MLCDRYEQGSTIVIGRIRDYLKRDVTVVFPKRQEWGYLADYVFDLGFLMNNVFGVEDRKRIDAFVKTNVVMYTARRQVKYVYNRVLYDYIATYLRSNNDVSLFMDWIGMILNKLATEYKLPITKLVREDVRNPNTKLSLLPRFDKYEYASFVTLLVWALLDRYGKWDENQEYIEFKAAVVDFKWILWRLTNNFFNNRFNINTDIANLYGINADSIIRAFNRYLNKLHRKGVIIVERRRVGFQGKFEVVIKMPRDVYFGMPRRVYWDTHRQIVKVLKINKLLEGKITFDEWLKGTELYDEYYVNRLYGDVYHCKEYGGTVHNRGN